MNVVVKLLAIATLSLASSCSYSLKFILYNNATTDITVWKEGNKSSVTVAPGTSKEFERLPVALTLDFGQDGMEYSLVDVQFGAFISDGRVNLQAENDAKLYVVPIEATFPVKEFPPQPRGFPLSPVKQADLT